jgi:lipoate-protein ligase A
MTLEQWRLLDLGPLDPLDSQIIYDIVAQAITEKKADNTLIICWPAKPIVCLGYFQEADKDVDLAFCRANNIIVTRRVIGGGGVYLDDGQMFYQLIGRIDSPTTPRSIDAYYRKFLEAPVQAYRNLGIDAEYKPVNDIQVGGKKISGNGAGDVGDARILTGNLIFDFNFDMMVKVLKVPDEKFRDKVAKSLRERLTTILLQKGSLPDRSIVKQDLLRLYEETLDIDLKKGSLSGWEKRRMAKLRSKYVSDEWLHWHGDAALTDARTVKLSATSSVGTANHKAPGGLIRVTLEEGEETIRDIVVSGDFFLVPSNSITAIEQALLGAKTTGDDIIDRLRKAYNDVGIDSPGVTPEDFETAVKLALGPK